MRCSWPNGSTRRGTGAPVDGLAAVAALPLPAVAARVAARGGPRVTTNKVFRIAIAVLLLLASQAAAALGLGQIRLKSGLGEPLLAEIPIVSSVPGELERLRVGLASPETFARIGLDPPRGVVADLQFNLALGDDGQPVIRVTSPQPIDEPMLSFLVEVDWGQGRLVREYSALVDAPRTVSAPLAPPVQAPVAAPSNTIVRAPAGTAQAEPDPAGESLADAAPAEPPAESQAPAQPEAVVAPAPMPPAPPAAAQRPGELRVQSGDTLSQIARGLELEGSLEQAMIALLRSNPGAFIDGNIHLLRAGAVLRVPGGSTVAEIDAAQALAQVREQTRAWRQATQAVAQPAADAGAATQVAGDASDTAGAEGAPEAAVTDARLEIVPPGASDATAAGTRSGISEGGEGDTMRQELQQANEVLAAREAELDEMKSRLAELEKIQADQRELISLKDNELASVQAELAQAREQDGPAAGAGAGWWIGGGVLLLLVLLGAWLMRRKADQVPRFRAPAEAVDAPAPSDPRASAFPARAPAAAVTAPAWHAGGPENERPSPAPQATELAAPAVAAPSIDPVPEDRGADLSPDSPADTPATPPGATGGDAVDGETGFQAETPGHERLELARAYLDLGDGDSARQLLTELVVSGDLASRQEAARMLRELD